MLCCNTPTGGITLRGDVKGAYLTSKFSGPKTYLRLTGLKNLPESLRRGIEGVVDPCVLLQSSVYALGRGDTDWGQKSRGVLREVGAQLIKDVGEDSIWIWEDSVVVVVYNDDFQVSGPRRGSITQFSILHEKLGSLRRLAS